jgi:hypothetical protein
MPIPAAGESPAYAGTWDCAKKTIKREGFFGLYKGMNIWREEFHLKTFLLQHAVKGTHFLVTDLNNSDPVQTS